MLGLGSSKEAQFKRSLWHALTADIWEPTTQYHTDHCWARRLWLESSSLHRSGGDIQAQSGDWCGCAPGLCCSTLQDNMGSVQKPRRPGSAHSSSSSPHLGEPNLPVPETPAISNCPSLTHTHTTHAFHSFTLSCTLPPFHPSQPPC